MKLSKLACGVALAGSLFATDAFADAGHTGFEGIFQLSAPVLDQEYKISGDKGTYQFPKNDDVMAGISGTLAFGYRFNAYTGLYLEQDLGGVWWTGDTADYIDDGWFIGGTYLALRGMFSVLNKNAEIDLQVGVGVMYTDGEKRGKKKVALMLNKDFEPTAAFAMKFGASFTYYVTSNIGVGLQLDYSLGINKQDIEGGGEFTQLMHLVNPGLHLRVGF